MITASLWALEQVLSSPGRAERFELLSTWRLALDLEYAKWAAALSPKICQITFFGMEESTGWGMKRRGAVRSVTSLWRHSVVRRSESLPAGSCF